MKNSFYLILSLFLLIACKKEKVEPEPSIYWGEVSAQRNGILWEVNPLAQENKKESGGINIQFHKTVTEYDIITEVVFLSKVPYELGTYPVINSSSLDDDGMIGATFGFSEADVLKAFYTVLESDSSSFISIISYDSITQEIRGTFDLTFLIKNNYSGEDFPDTIRFREGVFHTKITE